MIKAAARRARAGQRATGAVASAWLLLLLLALVAAMPARAAEPLRLAVARGPVSLPFYVAQANGYFDAAGARVALSDCVSGRACFERLAAGQADAATAAELLVTLAGFSDARFAIVASVSSSVHQIKLVARRDQGRAEAAGWLSGKRVGTVEGTSAHYYLDSWLLYHGLDPRSVRRVFLPPGQLPAALQQQDVDAVAVWEPHAAAARAALGDAAVLLPTPRVYTQHFTLVSARDTLAAREADLAALLRALAQAQAFIAARPAEAAALLAERLDLPAGVAQALLREHDFRLRIDQALVATMDSQARWAGHAGLVDAERRPVNLLRSIEPALLRKTLPGAVELVR